MNGNERAALMGQLIAMRNVLDGVLASLQEEPEVGCLHPEEKRKYGGEMGASTGFTCGQCGVFIPVPTIGA